MTPTSLGASQAPKPPGRALTRAKDRPPDQQEETPVAVSLPDPILAWRTKMRSALHALSDPASYITPPAEGPPSDARLASLLDTLDQLGYVAWSDRPAAVTARKFSSRVAGDSDRASLIYDLLLESITAIEGQILACLEAGASDERVIRTADFAQLQPVGIAGGDLSPSGNRIDVLVFAGTLASLPPGHKLQKLLPPEKCYLHAGISPSLVLGRSLVSILGDKGPPRAWYFTSDVKVLTARLRDQQNHERERLKELEQQEQLRAKRDFWNSPLGHAEKVRILLEKLRDKGEIPDELTFPPTIR